MIKKYIYIIGVAGGLFLSACSEESTQPEMDSNRTPISFGSTCVTGSISTSPLGRAASTDFPNNGQIAIVAANATEMTPDWDKLYLDHITATTGIKDVDGKYPITSGADYYWPFEIDKYLSIAAYSPASDVTLTAPKGKKEVSVSVEKAGTLFPDLLYTSPVGPAADASGKAFNKKHGTVDLGTFQHAMARLMVQVVPVDTKGNVIENYKNPKFKITKLEIETPVTKNTFDLSTSSWNAPVPQSDSRTLYTLIDNNHPQTLPYKSDNTKEYYVLPSTEGLSKIRFAIKDEIFDYEKAEGHLINSFLTKDSQPVKLETGKTTLLTIKVKTMDISTGDTGGVIFEGTLKDWEYKGNSSVTIE